MSYIKELAKNEVKQEIGSFKEVYIYGAGKEGQKIYQLLKNMNIDINSFVVTEKGKNPESIYGINVIGFSELKEHIRKQCAYIVAVTRKYRQEIIDILTKGGAEHIFIICREVWELNRKRPKLEVTAKIGCAINCKFCPQDILLKNYYKTDKNRKSILDFEDYKTCLAHMPKETIISFAGFVEPFFHPQGVEMVIYAYEKGYDVELFTTFMSLSFADYQRIKSIPFKQVVLHTPDEKRYANISITDEYALILNDALDSYRSDGLPFIDSANCQSEPSKEFLNIAGDRIIVESSLIDRAGNLNSEQLRSSGTKQGELKCNRTENFNHWVLLPDGTVVLCCMDFGLKHPLGNLIDSSYNEIIEGEIYRELRSNLKMSNSDVLCRNCTSSIVVMDKN